MPAIDHLSSERFPPFAVVAACSQLARVSASPSPPPRQLTSAQPSSPPPPPKLRILDTRRQSRSSRLPVAATPPDSVIPPPPPLPTSAGPSPRKCILPECGREASILRKQENNKDVLCEECWRNREELVDRLLGPLMEIMGPLEGGSTATTSAQGYAGFLENDFDYRVHKIFAGAEEDRKNRRSEQEEEEEKENIVIPATATDAAAERDTPDMVEGCRLRASGRHKNQRATAKEAVAVNTTTPLAESTTTTSTPPISRPVMRTRFQTPKRSLDVVADDEALDVITPPPSRLVRRSRVNAVPACAGCDDTSGSRPPARKMRKMSPTQVVMLSVMDENGGVPVEPLHTPVNNVSKNGRAKKTKKQALHKQQSISSFFKPVNSPDANGAPEMKVVNVVQNGQEAADENGTVATNTTKIILGKLASPPQERERYAKKRGRPWTNRAPLEERGTVRENGKSDEPTMEVKDPTPIEDILLQTDSFNEAGLVSPAQTDMTPPSDPPENMAKKRRRARRSIVTDEVEAEQAKSPSKANTVDLTGKPPVAEERPVRRFPSVIEIPGPDPAGDQGEIVEMAEPPKITVPEKSLWESLSFTEVKVEPQEQSLEDIELAPVKPAPTKRRKGSGRPRKKAAPADECIKIKKEPEGGFSWTVDTDFILPEPSRTRSVRPRRTAALEKEAPTRRSLRGGTRAHGIHSSNPLCQPKSRFSV
ncbi:hypothetical protein EX30DRAFT_246327 [Ascodesmis nigricans]|uniref:Uncharacterized protein n=1 Tax=Ascodesmis nigricans TaxID=341454 RepID=A0A4S2MQ84_9PEZI|nr:hypothetical protein EX30DRAFT_246327 [Ascodesmis nigricans]